VKNQLKYIPNIYTKQSQISTFQSCFANW